MIKKALTFAALYLMPAILVFVGFSAGHLPYPAAIPLNVIVW